MNRVFRRVELGREASDVYQGNGSRHSLLKRVFEDASRVVVISDAGVEGSLRSRFPDLDRFEWLTVASGEESKSLERASELWSKLCGLKADRGTAVLAIGGGMITDLAGFVAGTYLRGLPFYSLPTSLLAMVDASVGGKVGIDLPEGKNLVGQFYPARAVAIDPELLDTLPKGEWASGMAEVIKHGVLQGSPLWDTLLRLSREDLNDPATRESFLAQAVEVKLKVVVEDPYERTGQRATLNLGHTFGHALEWASSYGLRHGEAVGLGMLAAVRLSRSLRLLTRDFEEELLGLLRLWGLPISLPNPESDVWNWATMQLAFDRDKKSSSGAWRFIVPTRPGHVETVTSPDLEFVRQAVESLKAEPVGEEL